MKVWYDKDEAYPVWSLRDEAAGWLKGPVDLGDDLVQRFRDASEAFWKLNRELGDAIEAAEKAALHEETDA